MIKTKIIITKITSCGINGLCGFTLAVLDNIVLWIKWETFFVWILVDVDFFFFLSCLNNFQVKCPDFAL